MHLKIIIGIPAFNEEKKKYYYLSNKEDEGEKEITIEKDEYLIPFFEIKKNKSIRIFISGSTGSGKTYLCEKILKTTFKNVKQIYLFSYIYDDDYSKIKNLLQIILSKGLLVL